MQVLKLLSRLIDYPSEDLAEHLPDLINIVKAERSLDAVQQAQLIDFLNDRFSMDMMDWQSEYDGLFDRGRSLSLLLFEHVHGESRDRGQAMVDLHSQYKEAGLEIGVHELPDYIPLYLEFAATQGEAQAIGWLQDVAPIFALLTARLQRRKSNYSVLFESLIALSGAEVDLEDVKNQIANEKRDDTKEALDKVWEEEMVKFGADADTDACGTSNIPKPTDSQRRNHEMPVKIIGAQ